MFFKLKKEWQMVLVTIFLICTIFLWVRPWLPAEWFFDLVLIDDMFVFSEHSLRVFRTLAYANTLICFVFLCLLLRGTKQDLLMIVAYFFIVIADFFLVRNIDVVGLQTVGVTAFLIAQLFFMKRLHINCSNRVKIIDIVLRVVVSVVVLAIAIPLLGDLFAPLYFVVAIYISNLAMNVVLGIINFKKHPTLSIGLICLFLCDIAVGFQFRGQAWLGIVFPMDVAWLFYGPAKILIVLSLLHKQTKAESESVFKNEKTKSLL